MSQDLIPNTAGVCSIARTTSSHCNVLAYHELCTSYSQQRYKKKNKQNVSVKRNGQNPCDNLSANHLSKCWRLQHPCFCFLHCLYHVYVDKQHFSTQLCAVWWHSPQCEAITGTAGHFTSWAPCICHANILSTATRQNKWKERRGHRNHAISSPSTNHASPCNMFAVQY